MNECTHYYEEQGPLVEMILSIRISTTTAKNKDQLIQIIISIKVFTMTMKNKDHWIQIIQFGCLHAMANLAYLSESSFLVSIIVINDETFLELPKNT